MSARAAPDVKIAGRYDDDKHLRRGQPAAFALATAFAFIMLVLTGILVHREDSGGSFRPYSERGALHFLLFASVWTSVLTPICLVLLQIHPGHALVSLGSHVIYCLFTWAVWLSGAAAFIATYYRGDDDCYSNNCGLSQAIIGLSWVLAVLWTIIAVIAVLVGVRAARNGVGFGRRLVAI